MPEYDEIQLAACPFHYDSFPVKSVEVERQGELSTDLHQIVRSQLLQALEQT